MDSNSKTIFTNLNKEYYFKDAMRRLTTNTGLSELDYSYFLSLSFLMYEEYLNKNEEISSYIEFAYYLVLKYSLNTKDYKPLLLFSLNNGLYPIAKSIFDLSDKNNESIHDILCESGIKLYERNGIYELKKQHDYRNALIKSQAQNRAYIAPTSYGKSSAIIEDIEKNGTNKIGIIVPKKALIWQTFKNIKAIARKLKYKILLHDSEYQPNDGNVICVFTQERALRLIQDSAFSFDTLYIDEAHNLFKKDDRNILLARLIKLNKKKNPQQKVIYLSPLIKDANDLIFNKNDVIDMQKIDFNIKELDVRFFENNGNVFAYNRFVNEFYELEPKYQNYFDYISDNMGEKNLIYFHTPKEIEQFANTILEYIQDNHFLNQEIIDNKDLIELSEVITKYIDEEYNLVELIKHGIVYIHGKMPDSIKDYILNKFVTLKGMRFLIANSTILEGMNLSLDRLFIFNVYSLKQNELINLCGRVNRLIDVFKNNNLEKLLCQIHFIDAKGKTESVRKKIALLRCDETDVVLNPMLLNAEAKDDKLAKIVEDENSYIDNYLGVDIKTILVKNGLSTLFKDDKDLIKNIEKIISTHDLAFEQAHIIDKIKNVFFTKKIVEKIKENGISRFANEEAQSFYKHYLNYVYHTDLKNKIQYFMKYFEETKAKKLYMGSLGEEAEKNDFEDGPYISLTKKNRKQRINLAVVKSKLEDDFVGFDLNKFVKTLFDLGLATQEEYDNFLYGTTDASKLELYKMGLTQSLVNFIEQNKLFSEYKMKDGIMTISDAFKKALMNQDDYIKYEVSKFVD